MLEKMALWYDRKGKKILYIVFVLISIYIFFKYILEFVLPFVIAWGLSYLLNPFVTFLDRKLRIRRGFGTLLAIGTILGGIVSVLTVITRQLWSQVKSLAQNFDVYRMEMEYFIDLVDLQIQEVMSKFPLAGAFSSIESLLTEGLSYISGFLNEIVKGTTTIVSGVPNALFFVIVTLLATFFMTKDHEEIKAHIKKSMPRGMRRQLNLLKGGLKGALGGYIRTQLILMCFTFCICLTGLSILGREYVLLIAVGIAVLDALPVFGSGAILIPWAIYYLIIGNVALGIGLLCVYGVIVVMRQIMEPKVLSTQIDVHPLLTLMSMYIGFRAVGVIGMIVGPITVVMFKTLQRTGMMEGLDLREERE